MGLSCIIIDDSLFIRQTVTQMIEQTGHQVIATFANGPDFLNAIPVEDYTPDIVFCDIILPEMTGLDLLTMISEGFPSTKIIMLSGVTQPEAISAALRLGAIDFLQKPVEKERLVELLHKLSSSAEVPSVEQLSTIGATCELLSGFFEELTAHSSSTLRKVIDHQIWSILEDVNKRTSQMFKIDLTRAVIEPHSQIWGTYSEEEVITVLKSIPREIEFELQFLYTDEFVKNLYDQAIMTMASKRRHANLFKKVSPQQARIPRIPKLGDPTAHQVTKASTSIEELNKAISLAFFVFDMSGPEVHSRINSEILSENDLMKNSIFYYTLVGEDNTVQEGLFGPLPVSSEGTDHISSLAYTTTKLNSSGEQKVIILSVFYTPDADRIVADYNKLSFIIKTRLAPFDYISDIDKTVLRGILDDIIEYLLSN